MDPLEGTDVILHERPALPRAEERIEPGSVLDVTPILPDFDDEVLLAHTQREYEQPLAERRPQSIPFDRHPSVFIGARWREYAVTMGWRSR